MRFSNGSCGMTDEYQLTNVQGKRSVPVVPMHLDGFHWFSDCRSDLGFRDWDIATRRVGSVWARVSVGVARVGGRTVRVR